MKLLTEMQDGCVHACGVCVDTEHAPPLAVAQLEHDAAAAHALMQALDKANHAQWTMYQNPSYAALCYADELLHQWGWK